MIAKIFLTLILVFTTNSSMAAISVAGPFTRATHGANGAVFGIFKNASDKPVSLTSASSVHAQKVEFHSTQEEKDPKTGQTFFKMVPQPAILIPANGKTVLKPGGLHIMLIDLKGPLVEKEKITVDLTFDNGEHLALVVPVKALGALDCGCQKVKDEELCQ